MVLALYKVTRGFPNDESPPFAIFRKLANDISRKGVFSMPYETLLLESSEHVATVILNRPDKRNSINTQMIADLQSALDAIEKTHTRVVILTGAGKAFCAGMDLSLLQAIATQSPSEN